MRILYFDLNCSGDFFESYSCNPKRYGGGGAFARWAKEILNKNNNIFKIIAPRQCFNELQDWENKNSCQPIDDVLMEVSRLSHLRTYSPYSHRPQVLLPHSYER
jgi:hypothetical protein